MKDARIRPATPGDLAAMLAILPRLAEFELPPRRSAEDLWKGDAKTLERWAADGDPALIVLVADAPEAGVVGLALVRLQPEFMSGAPGAHLEAIGITPAADGHGIGKRLLAEAERAAIARGAQSMTLHVFANNERARAVYDRTGYRGELLRYVKHLDD
ncbi:MAG: GNAT family N-acetyltransferase [Thioalkalivibrio sp.]|nr:GNAT family N-acetyltransferase [Thioalkalivibrio sp.]